MSQAKGDRRERELVNRLDEAGFAVMRAPASGSATERELPDVLAGDGEVFYAIEVKSSAESAIYLTGEEVEALVYFAQNFGAKPRIGVRFDREEWFFFHPGDLHVTDGGNYRVKKETALAEGTDFAELVGRSKKVTLDDLGDGATGGDSDGGSVESGVATGDGADVDTGASANAGENANAYLDGNEGEDEGEHADQKSDTGSDVVRILIAVEQGVMDVEEAADMLE